MKVFLLALAASVACPCLAQIPAAGQATSSGPSIAARIAAMPKDLPRAKGPSLQVAITLALAAAEACKAKGNNASVLVTDSAGVPIVLLSGDGAGERSQLIAQSKANTAIKYRMSSTEVKRKSMTDPALAKAISLDPDIGEVRLGAFPLMDGGELIGALSVSGSAGGVDACAKDAMAKTPLH